uniref:CCHC-type domain-containing protein n=1 Tax=Cannabis sativa TaxID=3483 RepID=A0A803QQX9_CANSA
MVAIRTTVDKSGICDGDTAMENTQHIKKYVDENHIDEDPKDDPEDDDPKEDGKDKEEEYYYEPDPTVAKMAKELTKNKKKDKEIGAMGNKEKDCSHCSTEQYEYCQPTSVEKEVLHRCYGKKSENGREREIKGKKTGASSSDRVIKTRSMDALGIQELEVEEAEDSMEQCHHLIEQYVERVFSPEESEALILRQSEIRQDFSDWLSIADRATQDVNSGKRISPQILRSNIVRNLEIWFEQSKNDAGKEETKKKVKIEDRLQYPKILIQASLAQDFPEKISFIDEFDHEVDLDIKYEWLPLVCYNCSGIGHRTSNCRKKEEKKEAGKQVWMPKKPTINVEKQLDDDGFQKVSKGKKVLPRKEAEGTSTKNMFESLNDDFEIVAGIENDCGIAEQGNEQNTGGEGDPSSSNG